MPSVSTFALSTLNSTNGFRLTGATAEAWLGRAVSAAGDVNNDGYDDLLLGAWGGDVGGNDTGSTYVVFGRAARFASSLSLTTLNGSNGFRLDGTAEDDLSGFSVSSAGDVNGDGCDDLLIGAWGADGGGGNSGAAFVVFGRNRGFASTLALSTLNGSTGFRLDGVAEDAFTGQSVSSAGDVNGDGLDDLLIGAWGANSETGTCYVVFGRATPFPARLSLTSLAANQGFRLIGVAEGEKSGMAVSQAGDVNGDGFQDLLIGAPLGFVNAVGPAAGYVVFGHAGAFPTSLDLSTLDGRNGFRLVGAGSYENHQSVSAAGDVNGDGFDDLILGSTGFGDHTVATVVFGRASGFTADLDVTAASFQITSEAVDDGTDRAVSGAGDLNGDGFDDLIIGVPGAEVDGAARGVGYVILGRASGLTGELSLATLDGVNGLSWNGVTEDDHLGRSVHRIGDLNGDGFDDLVLGADGVDASDTDTGAVYVVLGSNITNASRTANNQTGDADANQLHGGLGADLLVGGGGADVLTGGLGNDTLTVADGDFVRVDGDRGTDTLRLDGTLHDLDLRVLRERVRGIEILQGNDQDNLLTAVRGVTTLIGGAGNDTYVVDATTDGITETATTDNDTVRSAISWVLADRLENLVLIGPGPLQATGNSLANTLTGNSGDNLLDGRAGADAMAGGAGRDTYGVDNPADTVQEAAGLGVDTVQSSVSFILGSNLENLTLTGIGAIDGTGNALNNILTGNSGINTLTGGAGHDTYVLNAMGDRLVENPGEGLDTVRSSVHVVLSDNLETLILTGADAINGTGNGQVNTLTGNPGPNVLNGGGGADVLNGGLGNDTYVVDDLGDRILERAGGGIDLVRAFIDWTLADHLENLALVGTNPVTATGNGLANEITGNMANNTLVGGGGQDTLTGGLGADLFMLPRAGQGQQRMTDFSRQEEDRLGVVSRHFGNLALGPLVPTLFAGNPTGVATTEVQRFVFNTNTRLLSYDADGNGPRVATPLAMLNTIITSQFIQVVSG